MATPIAVGLKDAETLTGISRDVIYAACKTGALPSRRNGTRFIVRVSDLEAWIDQLPSGADDE